MFQSFPGTFRIYMEPRQQAIDPFAILRSQSFINDRIELPVDSRPGSPSNLQQGSESRKLISLPHEFLDCDVDNVGEIVRVRLAARLAFATIFRAFASEAVTPT